MWGVKIIMLGILIIVAKLDEDPHTGMGLSHVRCMSRYTPPSVRGGTGTCILQVGFQIAKKMQIYTKV